MISPENRQLLEELHKTNYGKALKAFLSEELESLNTVKGVKSLEEALGREKAVNLIEKLFSFMEKTNPQGTGKKQQYN